jgi:WD repeat-containing protein 48
MENKPAQSKKRTQLSVIIRDPVEKLHRSGINTVKFEPNGSQSSDRLFTAGRDSIIRVYTNLVPSGLSGGGDADVDRFYQMSLSHHTDWVNDIVLCNKSNIGSV